MPKSFLAHFCCLNDSQRMHSVQLVNAESPNYIGEQATKLAAAIHLYMTQEKHIGTVGLIMTLISFDNCIEFRDCRYYLDNVSEIKSNDAKSLLTLTNVPTMYIQAINMNAVSDLFNLVNDPTFIINYDWNRELILKHNPLFIDLFDAFKVCIEQNIAFNFERFCEQLKY